MRTVAEQKPANIYCAYCRGAGGLVCECDRLLKQIEGQPHHLVEMVNGPFAGMIITDPGNLDLTIAVCGPELGAGKTAIYEWVSVGVIEGNDSSVKRYNFVRLMALHTIERMPQTAADITGEDA